MKYYKCLNCYFNVTEQDERCANCGVLYPLLSLEFKEKSDTLPMTIGTILPSLLFFLVMYSIGQQKGNNDGIVIACCYMPVLIPVSYLGTAFVLGLFYKSHKWKSEQAITHRKSPYSESLVFKENIIQTRKNELLRREQQISSVLSKARLNSTEKWKQVSTMLEDSIKILKRQEAKYNLKAIEIDTVRLQNKLAPFVYNTDSFSYIQISSNLTEIEFARGKAFEIDIEINSQSNFLEDSSESKELTQRLRDIQSSIKKLHDAYLGKQAVLALQDINPVDDASNPILPPVKAIQESEVFNIQVSITDFSESFKELESEYMRVQAEEDIAKQVDKIINETNKPR